MSVPHPRGVQPIKFSHSDDLNTLILLVNELSDAFKSNRAATEQVCAIADELNDGLEQQPEEKEDDTETIIDEQIVIDRRRSMLVENANLQIRIRNQHIKNQALTKLLRVCCLSLAKCLDQVRNHVNRQTMKTLQMHHDYITQIQNLQDDYIRLSLANSELQQKVFNMSRSLGTILNSASTWNENKKSVDYIYALQATVNEINGL